MSTKEQREEASLFLMQASLGADYTLIDDVANLGISTWIDNQLANTYDNTNDSFKERTKKIFQDFQTQAAAKYPATYKTGNATLPYNFYFRMAWWHRVLSKNNTNASTDTNITTSQEKNKENILRHRVALALSEILVISDKSILELDAVAMASFYDLLYEHAFDNYNTLLQKVSLHPMMGVFLTHLNNKKANGNQHPDENYAREIMQLFTIGLNELETNGNEKKDANGDFIPTYDNKDIKELARVFTGIKASKYEYEYPSSIPGFVNGAAIDLRTVSNKAHITIPFVNMEEPMIEQSNEHDQGEKRIFEGKAYSITVPAGGNLNSEITQVGNELVAHPNTAAFIAKKLIQQLVSSNPSPAYIQAVANKFGSNGNLKETIKEILTHPEARDTSSKKLKSPLFRITQILNSFKVTNISKKFWMRGDMVDSLLKNHVLSSPTVFNFYLPNYAPHGEIEDDGKVAPEFQLHNSSTSISYVNMMYNLLFGAGNSIEVVVPTKIHPTDQFRTADTTEANDKLKFDFTNEKAILSAAGSNEVKLENLIKRVSLVLIGKEEISIEDKIKDTIINEIGFANQDWVIQTVIFMVAISADFTIQRKR